MNQRTAELSEKAQRNSDRVWALGGTKRWRQAREKKKQNNNSGRTFGESTYTHHSLKRIHMQSKIFTHV